MPDLSAALKDYRTTRSKESREELILRSMPLVRYVVKKYVNCLPQSMERDDLIDSGVCGLIEAVERYDPNKNTKFETYAILRIRGAVLDELRARDWKPRSLRRKAREYDEVCARLEQEPNGSLDPEKVAKALGLSSEEMEKLISDISFVSFVSIDDGQPDTEESGSLASRLEDPRSPDPTQPIQFEEKKRAMMSALKRLDEHERLVITLYYFEGLYLKEIGELLEVTESRVSQIHTAALAQMKEMMSEFV